jgi:hypothetical protein
MSNQSAAPQPPEKVVAPKPGKSADDLAREAAEAAAADANQAPDAGTPTARRPLGRREAKLHYPPRPGFVRRWINEWPGRIGNAQAGGWTHVTENGKPVTRVVGVAEAGGPLHAYLMEIPQEFYDEDAAQKQLGLNEIDAQIYGGTFNAEPDDKRYGEVKARVQRGLG